MHVARAHETGEPPRPARRRRRAWRVALVVAVATAVVAALAFDLRSIPSVSMEPTLDGNADGGDRVLVDRVTLKLRAPRRFEILAFRHPLDPDREMVKRIVGLPRELVQVTDGDLFVNGRRLRKDAEERRVTRVPLFRSTLRAMRDGLAAPAPRATAIDGDRFRIDARDLAEPRPEAALTTRILPSDGYEDVHGVVHPGAGLAVGDLILEARVRLEGKTAAIFAELRDGGDVVLIEVRRVGESGATALRVERSYPEPVRNAAARIERQVLYEGAGPAWLDGEERLVTFSNVDHRASLEIDGRDVLPPLDFDGSHPALRTASDDLSLRTSGARLGAWGGVAEVGAVALYRDLHFVSQGRYANRESFSLGDNELFVLGDLSSNSEDGRHFGAVAPRDWIGLVRAIVAPAERRRWLP